jgi:Uma2 family endonuclease
MATTALSNAYEAEIVYPDSDGKPIADNTIQYQYLITIQVGLDRLFDQQPDVFVAGDLLWYPVKGRREICAAPDVMVVFGRPKGDRGSYKQWEESGIAPQVVFEILSPGNTATEMRTKRKFYTRHGVEEYYEYDPDSGTLEVWQRTGDFFRLIQFESEWRSPRLGVSMKIEADGELSIYFPDGRKFEKPKDALNRAELEVAEAKAEIARLTAKLRELGIDPN